MRTLFAFGAFSWMQAVCGVIFSQADRLFLGVSLGAVAVASYALCAQMAQPIYGFAASGLHFLFPHLAGRSAAHSPSVLRKGVLTAFACNLLFVTASTAALLLFGQRILHAWAGDAIARSSVTVLPIIVWSTALLGLNVTGTYTLFALGRVRTVTWLSFAGGTAMLMMMVYLLPRFGIAGLAVSRLVYGATTLLLYFPLVRQLTRGHDAHITIPAGKPVCEEV
jgi:O-antigen/teichoic acid export membrane protein